MTDLGVECIAEGIETLEEAQVCQHLGCTYGQGFLFGRPQPLAVLSTSSLVAPAHQGSQVISRPA
jgi:EAL domain-containing protein (putative c-di-GMP-specific phosphodiesterase class I)